MSRCFLLLVFFLLLDVPVRYLPLPCCSAKAGAACPEAVAASLLVRFCFFFFAPFFGNGFLLIGGGRLRSGRDLPVQVVLVDDARGLEERVDARTDAAAH